MKKSFTDKSGLELQGVSMQRVFEKIELLFEDKAKIKGVDLKINYISDAVVLSNESMLINEVLANFMSNAIKFTPRGRSISIMWKTSKDYVTIYLEDQGVGIEASFLEKILEGEQAESSEGTEGEQGNGYGMQIALNSIASMM